MLEAVVIVQSVVIVWLVLAHLWTRQRFSEAIERDAHIANALQALSNACELLKKYCIALEKQHNELEADVTARLATCKSNFTIHEVSEKAGQ